MVCGAPRIRIPWESITVHSMLCDRIYHLRSLKYTWTTRTSQEVMARVTCIDDLENECPNVRHDKALDDETRQRLLCGDGDDENIALGNMHVTRGKVANTCNFGHSRRQNPFIVWRCCQCGSPNAAACSPDRCPVCGHRRSSCCPTCYDLPCSKSKGRW